MRYPFYYHLTGLLFILTALLLMTSCKVYQIDASTLSPTERERLLQPNTTSYGAHYWVDPYWSQPWNLHRPYWGVRLDLNRKRKHYGNNTRNVNPVRGSRGSGNSVNRHSTRPKSKPRQADDLLQRERLPLRPRKTKPNVKH